MQTEAYAAVNMLPGEGEHLKLKDYVHYAGNSGRMQAFSLLMAVKLFQYGGTSLGRTKQNSFSN
jgi:hypothetical protein